MQVVVLGMHRSGTSALARVLNLMGLYFGGEGSSTGRNVENAKGFWERRDVRTLNDQILLAADSDWDCVSQFSPERIPDAVRARYVSLATDITMDLDAHRPWFLKEPRMCMLLPLWRQAMELPVCVHVCRNPVAVARSLQVRNEIPIAVGLALWELYNVRALAASADLPRVFSSYEDLLVRPAKAVAHLRAGLVQHGSYPLREPADSELTAALDRNLRHQRASQSALKAATPRQRRLYDLLTGAIADPAIVETVPTVSQDSLDVLREYEKSVDLAGRRSAVERREQERTALRTSVQLAMKNLDLAHAKERIEDWRERAGTAERRLEETRRNLEGTQRRESGLQTGLAVMEQKAAMREREADAMTRQLWALRRSHEELRQAEKEARERIEDWRGRAGAAGRRLEETRRNLESTQRRESGLQTRLAVMEQKAAMREREADAMTRQLWSLRRSHEELRQAAKEASDRRFAILSSIPMWDAELARAKSVRAELRGMVAELETGIDALLASKRWRVGNAVVSLFRPRQQGLAESRRLQVTLHAATRTGSVTMLDALSGLGEDAVRCLPNHSEIICEHLGSSKGRDADLFDAFLQRRLVSAVRQTDVRVLRQYIESLTSLAELLIESKRWRLGNWLLGLPRRLTLRKVRMTGADAIAAAVAAARHASDQASDVGAWSRHSVPAGARDEPLPVPPSEARSETKLGPLFEANELWNSHVDIIVCVHNALDHVERCLEAIADKTTVPYRLIVVNDGSDDRTSARLRQLTNETDEMELVETAGGPLGYTRAANCGLRASTADFVVLLNSDTIVPRLWLEGLLDAMGSGSDIGAVGPLSNAASWQSVPTRVNSEGDWMVNVLPAGYNVDEYAELIHTLSARAFPRVPLLNGFCIMLRRTVLDSVGLLDEESFPRGYGEENDYCLRMRQGGFSLAIADHCFVYHAKSQSFGSERGELARRGGRALAGKHGDAVIADATAALEANAALRDMREALQSYPSISDGPDDGRFARSYCRHWQAKSHGVLFVLPVKGGSGGANSVVQEATGMRTLGVDARIAAHRRYADSLHRFYPAMVDAGDTFVFYGSDEELYRHAAAFDVIVATLWSTPALIAPFAAQHPEKTYVYYVQDYEPWFFPNDPDNKAVALDSYTVIPGMVLMAKTDWICRTVESRHERRVLRVAPSLDHRIYRPRADAKMGEAATVVAMIRPSTPRRAPIRTLRTLKALVAAVGDQVRIEVFGCAEGDLAPFVKDKAPRLLDGFTFQNHGVLPSDGVATLMQAADIFVDLSDYQAFGRTGLEAMACGCAVVLPACGGVHEYAVDGSNAVIVQPTDIDETVRRLTELVRDAESRREMQRRAIETASRYCIGRASLSELSVFRLAWRMRGGWAASAGTFAAHPIDS